MQVSAAEQTAFLRPRWLHKYQKAFEMGFQTALEYRANFLISLISAAYPIFIQSFLWTAIFQAGTAQILYGYTYQQMIAYTFLAGLTSRIVRTGFEYEIMDDVKNGRYSRFLVQPMGYFPYRLCSFYGQKVPNTAMILLLLAGVLALLNTVLGIPIEAVRIAIFLAALVLAITLNFLIFYCIAAVSFWIVEIGFLFEGIRIVFILLSGGIFPLEVFGERFVQLVRLLPFPYTVSFPINVLNGRLPVGEIWLGFVVQLVWTVLIAALAQALWKLGGRRYIAVGG
jgi:ABC-2 type transport system permease protein